MIQVLQRNSNCLETLTKQEFERFFGISLTSRLRFQKASMYPHIIRKAARAIRKDELEVKAKWAGVHYHKEIVTGAVANMSIRWIGEGFGYGAFAEKTFKAGEFIGEYTGEIRKRIPQTDQDNEYIFEYRIGDWSRNPYIIDALDSGNLTRFINHSEDPNIESMSVYAEGMMHIIFLTKKKIERGEQLSYHYGDTFWKQVSRKKKPLS